MKRILKLLVVIIVLAGVLAVGWRTYQVIQDRSKPVTGPRTDRGVLTVAVRRVETATLTRAVCVTGEVEALAAVDVVSKVTGTLERLRLPDGRLIEAGSHVEKGQVIAVIERDALEATVRAAEAALLRARIQAKPEVIAAQIEETRAAASEAKAHLAEAEANLENLKKEKDRMLKLFAEGSVTEQVKDKAVAACDAACEGCGALRAQVDRAEAVLALAQAQTKELAEAAVAQAEAALAQAQVSLAEAIIEAPITGVVSRKFVDEGDMVGPGGPLVKIVQMDVVKVIGGVSERHLALLVPGRTTARVAADAYPDEVFEGVVFRVGPEVDRRMRTVEVELRIPNPQHLLKPGMFTRLRLELDRREGVTVVPAAAIIHHEGKDLACVVIDGRARRRLLKLGLSEGDRHEVLEGLLPGDVVIVRGQRMVKEGDEVRCVNEAGGTSEDTTAGEQTVLEEPGR